MRVGVALAVLTVLAPGAGAGVEHWEVNELVASVGVDPSIRFVELHNPEGGCLFPTSRIDVRDAAGGLLGAVTPVTETTCFGPGWYLVLATPAGAAHFGLDPLASVPSLPGGAGQVCFASSATPYDCVRWGAVTGAVGDFYAPGDATAAAAPVDGFALARAQTTHVVADDWVLAAPTPLGPNDGTPWSPPDAGPPWPVVDAGPQPDAGIPDAGPDAGAPPDARPARDARSPELLTDPAGCGCTASAAADRSWWPPLVLVFVTRSRRRRRSARGRCGRAPATSARSPWTAPSPRGCSRTPRPRT